jgi:hypothetical protein
MERANTGKKNSIPSRETWKYHEEYIHDKLISKCIDNLFER